MGMDKNMEPTDDFIFDDLDEENSRDFGYDLDDLPDYLLEYDLDLDDTAFGPGSDPEESTEDPLIQRRDTEESESLEFIDLNEDQLCNLSKGKKRFSVVFMAFASVGIVVSAYIYIDSFWEEYRSEQKVEELRQDTAAALSEDISLDSTLEDVKNPYADLFAQNGDMAVWLVMEDTGIDYPVMQTMGNEEYYLHRNFYGEPDKSGCLLLDTDSSLDDSAATSNLIIHGHNMKLGTMFGELDQYADSDYWKEHQRAKLYTENELREYQVMAAFYDQVYFQTDQVFKYYNFFHADTEEEFDDFYNNIKALSLYDTGVEAQLGDQFLTLSTCSYHTEEGRFVVVCKEVARSQQFQGRQ